MLGKIAKLAEGRSGYFSMNLVRKLLLFSGLLLVFQSCQTGLSEKENLQQLEAQVMQVHDEAMADMGKIYLLRKDLSRLHDSLTARQADSARMRTVSRQAKLLLEADEAMMAWMRQYKAPAQTMPPDSARQYLQLELQKIEIVNSRIDSAIAVSQKILSDYDFKK